MAPFSVTSEGTTLIEGRATDSSDNVAITTPISVRIDKTAPAISSTTPTSVIVGSTPPTVQFTCTDTGGSGVASCTSVPAQGATLNTSVAGTVSFTVTAVDNVGNAATNTFTIDVKYNVCLLYNPTKPQPSTGAVAVKLQLCDTNGFNYSSPDIIVTALDLDGGSVVPQDSGGSNSPTHEFRYDSNLEGYIYNLNEEDLSPTEHTLHFSVSETPGAVYDAPFKIR